MSGALPDSKASFNWSLYSSAKTWKSTLMPIFASISLKRASFTALSWRWFVIQVTVVPRRLDPDAGAEAAAAADGGAPAADEAAAEGRAVGAGVAVAFAPQAARKARPASEAAPRRKWRRPSGCRGSVIETSSSSRRTRRQLPRIARAWPVASRLQGVRSHRPATIRRGLTHKAQRSVASSPLTRGADRCPTQTNPSRAADSRQRRSLDFYVVN